MSGSRCSGRLIPRCRRPPVRWPHDEVGAGASRDLEQPATRTVAIAAAQHAPHPPSIDDGPDELCIPLDPPHRARRPVLAQHATGPRPMAGVPGDGLTHGRDLRCRLCPDSCVAHVATQDSGGDEGTRTPDPCDANAVLFQLSYIPGTRATGVGRFGPAVYREWSATPSADADAGAGWIDAPSSAELPCARVLIATLTLVLSGVAVPAIGPVPRPGRDRTGRRYQRLDGADDAVPGLHACGCHRGSSGSATTPTCPCRRARASSTVTRRPAAALSAAAQRIHDNGGLFDAWACGPSTRPSLLQLGVIAGQPYRVSARRAAGHRRAVGHRACIGPGGPRRPGHQRPGGQRLPGRVPGRHGPGPAHARSTCGRPPGATSSWPRPCPGIADAATEATVEAIAGSLRPIPGSAADLPTPVTGSADSADPALEATLPDHLGAVALTRRSIAGESLVSSTDSVTGSIAGELGRLVNAPGDVSVALAVPTDSTAPLLIAGYRLARRDPGCGPGVPRFLPGRRLVRHPGRGSTRRS